MNNVDKSKVEHKLVAYSRKHKNQEAVACKDISEAATLSLSKIPSASMFLAKIVSEMLN